MTWPTPVANDDNKTPEGHLAKKPGRTVVTSLNIVATQMWRTPDAPGQSGGPRSRTGSQGQGHQLGVAEQAEQWMTPTSRDWKDGADPSETVPTNSLLSRQAPQTAMPGAESSETTQTSRRPSLAGMSSRTRSEVEALFRLSTRERTVVLGGWKNKKLWRERKGVLTTEKSRSFTRPTFRRQLNPNFVEWLMNWRPGWTSLAPLDCESPGTASYPSAPASPSAPSGELWNTPIAGLAGGGYPKETGGGNLLKRQIDNWPTPDTQNARGGQAMRSEAKGKHAMSLHHVVEGWDSEKARTTAGLWDGAE